KPIVTVPFSLSSSSELAEPLPSPVLPLASCPVPQAVIKPITSTKNKIESLFFIPLHTPCLRFIIVSFFSLNQSFETYTRSKTCTPLKLYNYSNQFHKLHIFGFFGIYMDLAGSRLFNLVDLETSSTKFKHAPNW